MVPLLPSPSSRRAWIEITILYLLMTGRPVALLAEGVDRNTSEVWPSSSVTVALLAEGVDRNLADKVSHIIKGVALLAEGVDRN